MIAQNLIPNSGFENIEVEKKDSKYYYSFTDWQSITSFEKWIGMSPFFSENFKENDSFDSALLEWYRPFCGDGQFFCLFPFFKNLYQAELIQPLEKDTVYYFEMYYKLRINKMPSSNITHGQIGVFFTNKDFSDTLSMYKLSRNKLGYVPQVLIKELDSTAIGKWKKFSYIFKSDKKYKFIIIGNHKKLMNQIPELYTKQIGITYKLDNLFLIPYSQYTIDPLNVINKDCLVFPKILFENKSYSLSEEIRENLNTIVEVLKINKYKVTIVGHTDNTGTISGNKELSILRAKSVYDYFLLNGINKELLSYKGEGSDNPIADNNQKIGRKNNRRVELIIN